MVRVVTLSNVHEHLHYSSRRFRDCLLADILASSNQNAKVCEKTLVTPEVSVIDIFVTPVPCDTRFWVLLDI